MLLTSNGSSSTMIAWNFIFSLIVSMTVSGLPPMPSTSTSRGERSYLLPLPNELSQSSSFSDRSIANDDEMDDEIPLSRLCLSPLASLSLTSTLNAFDQPPIPNNDDLSKVKGSDVESLTPNCHNANADDKIDNCQFMCAICLEDFVEDKEYELFRKLQYEDLDEKLGRLNYFDNVAEMAEKAGLVLPCMHKFHSKCIRSAAKSSSLFFKCPLCMTYIPHALIFIQGCLWDSAACDMKKEDTNWSVILKGYDALMNARIPPSQLLASLLTMSIEDSDEKLLVPHLVKEILGMMEDDNPTFGAHSIAGTSFLGYGKAKRRKLDKLTRNEVRREQRRRESQTMAIVQELNGQQQNREAAVIPGLQRSRPTARVIRRNGNSDENENDASNHQFSTSNWSKFKRLVSNFIRQPRTILRRRSSEISSNNDRLTMNQQDSPFATFPRNHYQQRRNQQPLEAFTYY